MKLVFENSEGEPIDIEVLPEDTFNDVQNRLFQNENFVLDMAKLEMPDKPLTMSTNVMEYYEGGGCQGIKAELMTDSLVTEQLFSPEGGVEELEHLQEISPLKISLKDEMNLQEQWEELKLADAVDMMSPRTREEVETTPSKVHPENIRFPENLLSEPMPRCRLCAEEIFEEDLAYLHEENSEDGITIADKINTCLPVVVSLNDKLPKQICSNCFVNLESSYVFANQVSLAEEKLIGFEMISKAEHMNCPLCCEGVMETVQADDAGSEDLTDKISEVTDNEQTNAKFQAVSRKRRLDSEDVDWQPEEELAPSKKRQSVGNKGRLKGVKNKSSKTRVALNCFICHLKLKDMHNALQHALSAHCDSKNQTYPCPLCEDTCRSEQELTTHIDTHFDKLCRKVTLIRCYLCGKQHSEPGEMYKHVLETHTDTRFSCTWCESEPLGAELLLDHVIHTHVQSGRLMCPVCSIEFADETLLREHFMSLHLEQCGTAYVCAECSVRFDTEEQQLRHMVQVHCASATYELPPYYTCAVCSNNFRSQYHLSKHTCNASHFVQALPSADALDELVCPKCDRRFPTKARLVFHIYNHEARSEHMRCDECFTQFTDEDTFYDHVRFQHEPDEPVECEVCRKVFKNEASLSCHMRRHQDTRNHECDECGKKFQNAQTLREHRVGHMEVKPFQCHICGAYLSRLSRLRVHLRFHSVKDSKASMNVFKCTSCHQVFPSMSQALKHIQNTHAEVQDMSLEQLEANMVFRCEFCDACFLTMGDLNTHRTARHPDPDAVNAYTCSVCNAHFATYARVTTHKLTHGINTESLILTGDGSEKTEAFVIPQYFLCNKCDKKSLHYTYLKIHNRFQHGVGKLMYTCHTCGDKFPTPWALQFHTKKQHGVTMKDSGVSEDVALVYCPHCEKPYKSETRLESHIRRFHTSTDNQDDGTSFMCETCGKTFLYKSMLDAHIDAHKGMKRFPCTVCEKRFTHRAGLLRHMKLHSDQDAFVCDFCGKKFRDRTERDNHCRAHTGERPFMCDVCGRFFHTKAVLLDHSRIHSDVRPYQCDVCNQSFRRSNTLKNHYLIHTGEKPFSCTQCNKSFRLRQTLTAHVKKDHGQGQSEQDQVLVDEDSADEGFREVDIVLPEASWKKGTFACTECEETFRLKVTLLAHMSKQHPGVRIEQDEHEASRSLLSHTPANSAKRKPVAKETRLVPTATEIQPGFSLLLK